MTYKTLLSSLAALAAVGGLVLAPATADAQGKRGNGNSHGRDNDNRRDNDRNRGNDNKRDNDRGRSNDNRRGNDNWDRNDNRRNDTRNNDDWRRRQEEQRRQDDWRRREDERRRAEEQRRWQESQRRNDNWRNDDRYYDSNRRQETKNEWRNLALAAGAISILGLLNNDSTLTFAGAAGALYSTYRYEQDRKSQNQHNRARAYYFSQPYFYRDGHRYDRRTVTRNGQRYYQFCRS